MFLRNIHASQVNAIIRNLHFHKMGEGAANFTKTKAYHLQLIKLIW